MPCSPEPDWVDDQYRFRRHDHSRCDAEVWRHTRPGATYATMITDLTAVPAETGPGHRGLLHDQVTGFLGGLDGQLGHDCLELDRGQSSK